MKKNDESREKYDANNGIKFKTPMIRSGLCDYSDAYIYVKRTIIIPKTGKAAAPNNSNKKVIFKNCTPYTNCKSKINNTQIDNANDNDVVMPIDSLIRYSDIHSRISGGLW